MSYPFIEYLSYKLKSYGKKGYPYLQILEEQVEKKGSSVSEVIKKEHFDIAVKKVLIGNLILSLKEISKIDFSEMVEELGGIEDILKQDPAKVYEKMDFGSKNMYRTKIKELASKAKISELYVAKTLLEMAKEEESKIDQNASIRQKRKTHIGYFLLEDTNALCKKLEIRARAKTAEQKARLYTAANLILPLLLSFGILIGIYLASQKLLLAILIGIICYLPISEITIQTMNYILRKSSKTDKTTKIRFQPRHTRNSCYFCNYSNNSKK